MSLADGRHQAGDVDDVALCFPQVRKSKLAVREEKGNTNSLKLAQSHVYIQFRCKLKTLKRYKSLKTSRKLNIHIKNYFLAQALNVNNVLVLDTSYDYN